MTRINGIPDDYYKHYETAGFFNVDLEHMHGHLRRMELPEEPLTRLRDTTAATFLVLGSATARNLDNMALIDRTLRPGQGAQDHVTIIDRNEDPLHSHRARSKFLDEWHANERAHPIPPVPGRKKRPELQYPSFALYQADMRQLPFKDESMDVVVTDYTFNFLDDPVDTAAAFGEASRVLTPGGMLLMSVMGSPHPDSPEPHVEKMASGLVLHELPHPVYEEFARNKGLALKAAAIVDGNDMGCGVFVKQA